MRKSSVLFVGLSFFSLPLIALAAWSPPQGGTPGSVGEATVATPINVGAETQGRIGRMLIITGKQMAGSSHMPSLYVDDSLQVGIVGENDSSLRDTNYKLDVKGKANIDELCITGICKTSWPTGADSMWLSAAGGAGIYYGAKVGADDQLAKRVGIGWADPQAKLDVYGRLTGSGTNVPILQVTAADANGTYPSGNDSPVGAAVHINAKGGYPLYVEADGADALIVDSKGSVGIGTSVPGAKLHVEGSPAPASGFSGYPGYSAGNIWPNGYIPESIFTRSSTGVVPATGGQVTYRGGIGLGPGVGIYSVNQNPAGSPYYGDIRFHTTVWNGSGYTNYDRVVIDQSGNVGIGTTGPVAPLEVVGANNTASGDGTLTVRSNNTATIDMGGTIYMGGSYTGTSRTTFAGIAGRKESSGGDIAGYLSLYSSKAGTGFVEGMRLTSAGNVGIGTTAPDPAYKLDVAGKIRATEICTASGCSSTVGGSRVTSETDPKVGTLTTDRVPKWGSTSLVDSSLTDTGSGLQWTDGTLLWRLGQAKFATNNSYWTYLTNGGDTYQNLAVGDLAVSNRLCLSDGCKTAWSQTGGGQWTQNGTKIAYNNGNVGIGILDPRHKLDIIGAAPQDGIIVNASDNPEIRLERGGTVKAYLGVAGNRGGYAPGTLTDSLVLRSEKALHLVSNGASAPTIGLTVTPTGNVGIGTPTPGAKLEIDVATAGVPFRTKAGTAGTWDIGQNVGGISGDDTFGFYSSTFGSGHSSYPIMQMNSATGNVLLGPSGTGNVGIGTPGPGTKLEVNTDVLAGLGATVKISNGYGNQNGAVRLDLNNGGAVSWIKGLVTGANTNSGSAMVFGVPSNTADGTERMRIDSNGNVGIGTTDPGTDKLKVSGTIHATGDICTEAGGGKCLSGFSSNASNGIFNNRISVGHGFAPFSNQGTAGTFYSAAANDPTFFYGIQDETTGSEKAGIWTNSAAGWLMTFQKNGNVGIGTTQPGVKLEVAGSVRGNQSGALRIDSGNGYIDVGAQNTGWAHFVTDRARFWFNGPVSVNSGQISSYLNDLLLQTDSTGSNPQTRMTISKDSGNVGIGAYPDSSAKLQVAGQVMISGGCSASTPCTDKVLTSDAIGFATWKTPAADVWGAPATNGSISYSGGNVGIGIGDPSFLIGGAGALTSSRLLAVAGSNNPGITLFNTSVGDRQFLLHAGTYTNQFGSTKSRFSIFDTGAQANRFTIDADGNVGVGDSRTLRGQSSRYLSIYGSTNPGLLIENATAGAGQFFFYADSVGGFRLYDTKAPTVNRLTIDSIGRLGIGINPKAKLDVDGDIKVLTNGTFGGSVSAGTQGFFGTTIVLNDGSSLALPQGGAKGTGGAPTDGSQYPARLNYQGGWNFMVPNSAGFRIRKADGTTDIFTLDADTKVATTKGVLKAEGGLVIETKTSASDPWCGTSATPSPAPANGQMWLCP